MTSDLEDLHFRIMKGCGCGATFSTAIRRIAEGKERLSWGVGAIAAHLMDKEDRKWVADRWGYKEDGDK